MRPSITIEELGELLPKKHFRLVDARVGANIKTQFLNEHLERAIHVDLDKDLADIKPNAAEGGRHPLPDVAAFAQLLGQLGIDPKTHLVVYDAMNGANAAARFWWMLRAVGHEKVQVLSGGFQAAIAARIPTSNALLRPRKKPAYPVSQWLLPTKTMEEVEKAVQNPNFTVVDVRDANRFRGEVEPIDLVAGHIIGAINIPFSNNLTTDGTFKSGAELADFYAPIFEKTPPRNTIVHCGSGVTACHTLLAMAEAGYEIPNLYVGSWSEWSRNGKEIGLG